MGPYLCLWIKFVPFFKKTFPKTDKIKIYARLSSIFSLQPVTMAATQADVTSYNPHGLTFLGHLTVKSGNHMFTILQYGGQGEKKTFEVKI
jgi:hypothetical protein